MLRLTSFFVQRYVLGRRTLVAQAPAFNLELRVPSGDAAGRHLYKRGMHARTMGDFLTTGLDLRPGDVVFDIGAGIGWYSLLLARIAPRGAAIHAFEPEPWARGLLQENANRNRADAVTVVGSAVGEDSGHALVHCNGRRRDSWHSLRAPSQMLEVDMVSLDDYCRRNGLASRPVGLIKLDIEGLEFFALRGAAHTLGHCRTVVTEFSPARLERANVDPVSLLDLLVERGFTPALLAPAGPRRVTRAELLADDRARPIVWTRSRPAERRQKPDTAALAI
jgi:FkbM family methyltransferase